MEFNLRYWFYLDTSVLIAALRAKEPLRVRAIRILDYPDSIVLSEAVRLETLPKACFYKNHIEKRFYEKIFQAVKVLPWSPEVLEKAYHLAKKYGLSAMDAIHVSFALSAGVNEFITCEKKDKPLFRVQELKITSLSDIGLDKNI